MKIYCLWGYFINLWHNSWFCLIINSQTVQFKGIFIGGTTLFSNRRKYWIEPNQYLHFLFQRSTHTAWKTNSLIPKVASLYLMTVPVFELPGTTSNMYFVHVNLMNSVENTKIQKKVCKEPSRSIVRIPHNVFIIPQIGTFWSPEQYC